MDLELGDASPRDGTGASLVRTPDAVTSLCGGPRIGWWFQGCGTPLRYESTANGIEYWRCPACGNPHWWKALM